MVSDHSQWSGCVNLVVLRFVQFRGFWFCGNTSKSSIFFLAWCARSRCAECWPRWTKRTWCRQPSTRRRTVGGSWCWADRHTWNGDAITVSTSLMLWNKERNSFVASRDRRTAGNQLAFLRQSGARSDRTST